MGADGSKLSYAKNEEQTEILMQQNVEIAKRLSQEQGIHKRKCHAMLHDMGKNLFAPMRLNNNNIIAQNQIEIEGVTYEILDFISKGGFGEVYKGQVRNKNRTVAIKIMKNIPNIREEIQNEIRFLNLTKKISLENHPVIYYYGSKFTSEKIHIAMELAFCDLLDFWFNKVVNMEIESKFLLGITIIVYVLRALTFLEKLDIIHGDIKPQNVVIIPDNDCFYVKLIDFGTVEKMDVSRAQLTVDATKAHTLFFASPEFVQRNSKNIMTRHLHKKSDAWAAGVMFYIFFFERLPWKDQFEYDVFCNDPHAKDIVVPRYGGYKRIVELLLKKNPDERSSAKATLMQMKGHTGLKSIIESLHENLCPVDDVCRMKVSDDIRNELAKLARPGHFVRAHNSPFGKSSLGARRQCRYGRICNRHDDVHREDFAHPGDSDYHAPGNASNGLFDKPICRYGSDCFRTETDHFDRYAHPNGSINKPGGASNHRQHAKPKCHFGASCHNTSVDHLNQYEHPDDSDHGHFGKEKCRYGAACYNKDPDHRRQYSHSNKSHQHSLHNHDHIQSVKQMCRYGSNCHDFDSDHRSRFAHPNDSTNGHSSKPKCRFDINCTKTNDREHMAKFRH